LLAVHYRAGLDYSDESLAAASAALTRLDTLVLALESYHEDHVGDPELDAVLAAARDAFTAALDDDLNVSAGLAAVFDLVREVNRRIEARSLSTDDARRVLGTLRDIDRVLGVLEDPAEEDLEPELQALLDERAAARAARDWDASDRLRDELADRGVAVEDTRDGQRWRRVALTTRG
jgi:cysteinyl-tRNA synthetase